MIISLHDDIVNEVADGSGTAYGYIGTDLEKNGMKNDIFDIVEKLENRKKPSVKRHMRM